MTTHCAQSVVLRVTDHGESDKLVTMFSRQHGRVIGIAKGAKRSKKRFVNKLEIFTLLGIAYRPPRRGGLLFISEAELENAFLSLRQDFRRYTAASYIGELILRFTTDNDPDTHLFSLLFWALHSLDNNDAPQKVISLFHLRLLGIVGYHPTLNHCSNCSSKVEGARTFMLSANTGAIVCSRCYSRQKKPARTLSTQTLKFLANAQHMELKKLHRLQLPNSNATETLRALHTYSIHILQQDIHSWKAVHTLFCKPTQRADHKRTSDTALPLHPCPS